MKTIKTITRGLEYKLDDSTSSPRMFILKLDDDSEIIIKESKQTALFNELSDILGV